MNSVIIFVRGNQSNTMNLHRLIYPILILLPVLSQAQKIKRNRQLQGILDSTELKLIRNQDLFQDYGWLKPDIRSKQIDLSTGSRDVSIGHASIQIEQVDSGLKLVYNGVEQVSQLEKCNNCYYDINILKLKPVVTTRWVPVTTYQMQMVPVPKTRMVTRYQYNSSTGTSQAVYTTESYTAYESRSVPKTTYQYQTTTTYVLDIPITSVYRFKDVITENDQILIYEIGDDKKTHFLQPISYVMATTEDKVNYVFIDSDVNGSFLDDMDKVVFNTWNPFSKDSNFRRMAHFKENRWYPISELKNNYFIEFNLLNENTIYSTNRNNKFKDVKGYGSLSVNGAPEDAYMMVNNRNFKKLSKKYKCQFGCYLVTLKRPGYLDHSESVCVTKENPDVTVNFKQTLTGKEVAVNNLFSTDYFITVKSEDGAEYNYYRQNKFQVPDEQITISIDNNGYVLEQAFDMDTIAELTIDYESEIKKLLPEEEEKEEPKEKKKGNRRDSGQPSNENEGGGTKEE